LILTLFLQPGARIRRTLYRQYKEDDLKSTDNKLPKFDIKTLSDSGHGSDGSAEVSTENSSDDEKYSAKVSSLSLKLGQFIIFLTRFKPEPETTSPQFM
jgi:hypothetical protein